MKVILAFILALIALTIVTAEEGIVRRMDFSSLRKRGLTKGKITFFEDDQLENAACYGRDGLPNYNAKPTDMIGAMKGLSKCYVCLQITNPSNKKKVIVKIIDQCEGCPTNNIDLTPKAFATVADPNDGIVSITWTPVTCPSKGRFPTFEKTLKKNKPKK